MDSESANSYRSEPTEKGAVIEIRVVRPSWREAWDAVDSVVAQERKMYEEHSARVEEYLRKTMAAGGGNGKEGRP
jgi:broad-specificity NMP kinase